MKGMRICFVYAGNPGAHTTYIATLLFPGETMSDVEKALNKALADIGMQISCRASDTSWEVVHSDRFLSRDTETGEFELGLDPQTRLMAELRASRWPRGRA